jgi:hypothetical protein
MDPLERIEALGDFEDFSIQARGRRVPGAAGPVAEHRCREAAAVENGRREGRGRPPGALEAARLLSILPDAFDRELRELVDDEDARWRRRQSPRSARSRSGRCIGDLIDRLAEPALNEAAIAALASFGDRIVGTLRDYLTDESMRAEVRREIPKVLEEIGSAPAQAVLIESVLDRDVVLRYHTIAALNRLGQAHPDRTTDRKLIESVLAAEIMGHYRSYQVLGRSAARSTTRPIRSSTAARVDGEGDRAHLPAPQDSLSAVRHAQRLRRPAVHRSGRARQRRRVHGLGVAAGSAPAGDPAVRLATCPSRRASRPPTACSAPRSAIARKRSR